MAWRGTSSPNIGITAQRRLSLDILARENINLIASGVHAMMSAKMRQEGSAPTKQTPGKRPSTIYRLIWKAARARKQITCIYGGCYREACPHILGYKKLGQEAVFAFQFGGDSTSRLPPQGDWRCFDLAGMTDVELRDGRWHSGTRHTKTQTCIQFVDVDVNVPDTLSRRQPLAFGSPDLRPPRRAGE